MFTFVLALAAEKKLLAGTIVAVDSTMLEANAAMKSIDARTRVRIGGSTCGGWPKRPASRTRRMKN